MHIIIITIIIILFSWVFCTTGLTCNRVHEVTHLWCYEMWANLNTLFCCGWKMQYFDFSFVLMYVRFMKFFWHNGQIVSAQELLRDKTSVGTFRNYCLCCFSTACHWLCFPDSHCAFTCYSVCFLHLLSSCTIFYIYSFQFLTNYSMYHSA